MIIKLLLALVIFLLIVLSAIFTQLPQFNINVNDDTKKRFKKIGKILINIRNESLNIYNSTKNKFKNIITNISDRIPDIPNINFPKLDFSCGIGDIDICYQFTKPFNNLMNGLEDGINYALWPLRKGTQFLGQQLDNVLSIIKRNLNKIWSFFSQQIKKLLDKLNLIIKKVNTVLENNNLIVYIRNKLFGSTYLSNITLITIFVVFLGIQSLGFLNNISNIFYLPFSFIIKN